MGRLLYEDHSDRFTHTRRRPETSRPTSRPRAPHLDGHEAARFRAEFEAAERRRFPVPDLMVYDCPYACPHRWLRRILAGRVVRWIRGLFSWGVS